MGYLSAETLDVSGGGGTFTVPSGCTFLLVKLAVSTGTAPTSVTLGGTAVTTVATVSNGDSLTSGIYSRVSPASGSLALGYSSAAAYGKATLEYYDGIDLVTPVRNSATAGGTYATSFSLGVTSVADDLCSDFIVIQENATATAGGSQTLILSTTFAVTPKMYAASRQTASGTTTTFSWTTNGLGQRQAQIAVALIPLAGTTQTIRPDSTVSNTGWTASTTTLWQDTSDQSDATYMSATADGSVAVLGLANPWPAFASVSGVVVTVRIRREF